MSSGALTAALGRSNRDRDITDLVPSAPECSYAACFCEVCKALVWYFQQIRAQILLTIALSVINILFIILGKCLEASWSCSPNCTSRIVQNICCICVQSKAGCAFVETKSWSRRRKGKMKMNLLIAMKLLKKFSSEYN